MANLLRLRLAGFVLFMAFGLISSAHALVPKGVGWRFAALPGQTFGNLAAGCVAVAARFTANSGSTNTVYKSSDEASGICHFDVFQRNIPNAPPSPGVAQGNKFSNVCPSNSTESGTACACNAGTRELNGQCLDPNGEWDEWCKAGKGSKWNDLRTDEMTYTGGPSPSKTCARPPMSDPSFMPTKGCTQDFQADWGASTETGKYTWQGTGIQDGTSCDMTPDGTDDPDDKPDAKPPECPDGKLVTFNGVQTCVALEKEDPPTEIKETETKKEPDGSTSTTNKTTTGTTACNPHTQTCTRVTTQTTKTANTGKPGIVDVEKVTKTTTCGPNGCTTTTTTSKGTEDDTGTPTGTGTTNTATKEGESKEGFCKENPELQMCKDSAFSGSCSASFRCDGDAIQCSIAKEQHQRNCKMFDDKSDESEIYQKEKAKDLQRDVTKDLPGNEEIDIAGKLSNADALGGGSCIQDLQITVSGQSISLPLSRLCSVLAQLGFILVAVSSLAAARIMLK